MHELASDGTLKWNRLTCFFFLRYNTRHNKYKPQYKILPSSKFS